MDGGGASIKTQHREWPTSDGLLTLLFLSSLQKCVYSNVTSENELLTTVNLAKKKLYVYSVSQLFESSSKNLVSETRQIFEKI